MAQSERAERPTRARSGRRSAEKRRAIVHAARTLFLRDGYARVSMDAVAARAGVSKPTLYKHFAGKEALFLAVVEESTAEMAAELGALVERHLGGAVDDVERSLAALGRAWISTDVAFPEHQALLVLIISEARHFPALVAAWREHGPRPVRRVLARHLRELADAGHLAVADAEAAADHFTALVTNPVSLRSLFGAAPLDAGEVDDLVRSGVRAFLRLYGPAAGGRGG